MSNGICALHERRNFARISPKGAVLVHAGGHTQRGRIADLGEGGMFVRTWSRAPDRLLELLVRLEIRLDGPRARWVHAIGRILRVGADGFAMSFERASPELLRLVRDLRSASQANDRVLSVVLIDPAEQRRSAMAAGFRTTGCRVTEAASPLEAITWLGESTFEPSVIAIAESLQKTYAREMHTFVERDHPNAKLITITDDIFEPDGFAHWLSSANTNADLPGRVRDALVAPHIRRRS
ncbi:MAG: PilZ domain-containing protein [Kofleriaceae bacterium]|nr:PilZ domain-containing protein [Kofleriaceae bacterium]